MIGPRMPKLTAKESKAAYDRVAERSSGLCEICGLNRATETHHRLHRSHGGPDTVHNLLRVCGRGNTSGCHGKAHTDTDRYRNGWAVKSGFNPALTPVMYRGELVMLTGDGGIA